VKKMKHKDTPSDENNSKELIKGSEKAPDEFTSSSEIEISKDLIFSELPIHLATHLEEFSNVFFKDNLDSELNYSKIKYQLDIWVQLFSFIKDNLDNFKILYTLWKLNNMPFSELKEIIHFSDNRLLINKLQKLKEIGKIRKMDPLDNECQYNKDVWKKVAHKSYTSFYCINNIDDKDLFLIEKYVPLSFKSEIDQRLSNHEKAKKVYDTILKKEAEMKKKSTEKRKTKLQKICTLLIWFCTQGYERLTYFDLYRNLKYDRELIRSKKDYNEWVNELSIREIIKRDGKNYLIINKKRLVSLGY